MKHATGLIIILFAFAGQLVANPSIEFSGGGYAFERDDTIAAAPQANIRLWLPISNHFSAGILSGAALNSQIQFDAMIAARLSVKFHRRWGCDINPALGIGIDTIVSLAIHPTAGIRFFFSPRWQLSAFLGWRKLFDKSSENSIITSLLAIEYRFGFHDFDGDWVPDKNDKCKTTPRHALVDKTGCGLDTDGDGVFDGLDRCPNTPLAALVDSFGCAMDSDGDGAYDGVDKCPDTPGNIPIDTLGCPRDSDNDGIPDYADSCADTPIGAIVDNTGCTKDSDEDGVPDGIDQGNGTPTGFDVDLFGCPRMPTAKGEVIYDLFTDAMELGAATLNQLSNAAKRIRAYPDRKTIIIIYTDTEGSPAYNRNRAANIGEKILTFLKEQGVKPETVVIKAMGEENPLETATVPEAKRRNRRAVFDVEEP